MVVVLAVFVVRVAFAVHAVLAVFANILMHLLCEGTTLYEDNDSGGSDGVESWPLAPYIMMLNMLIDTAAMAPQMYMIKNSDDVAPPMVTNFIGRNGFYVLLSDGGAWW